MAAAHLAPACGVYVVHMNGSGALIVQSVVTFERTRIETDKAGDGGKGTLGSAGLSGSPTVFGAKYGGAGLSGGDGGWSGLSGHGAPGPAIAMVYAGARPVTATVDFAPGPGGAPLGELRKTFDDPVIAKVLPAVSGQSLAEYEIK